MKTYLTEKNLGESLHKIFNSPFSNNVPFGKYRIDWYNSQLSLAVEFDGYWHYNNSMTQYRDAMKDKLLSSVGVTCIRIPYFIQLSTDTINSIFLLKGKYSDQWTQEYPHGFINNKALLPADFNELGIQKFITDLNRIQSNVRNQIIISLIERAQQIKLNISNFEKLSIVFPLSVISNIKNDIDLTDSESLLSKITLNLLT